MKPFRLITVERLRGRELDARAQELHTAAATQEQAVAERNRLIGQLAGGGNDAVSALGRWSGAELELANNFRQVLRQQILEQEERISTLDETLVAARQAWLTARGQLRAVQALHERHRVTVRAEQARLDQRELDEHAGTRRVTLRDLALSSDTDVSSDTEARIR